MGKKSLKEAVETILTEGTENAATLKPKSKSADEPKKLPADIDDTDPITVIHATLFQVTLQ